MSSGHTHSDFKSASIPRLNEWLRHSLVHARLFESKYSISRDFDIPYLAGYSRDGRTVYIDRHLPPTLMVGNKRVHVFPFLVTHERTEKALLDFASMRYNEAHQYATLAEHRELERAGISPVLYEKALDPYIKADRHEKILKVPRELDFRPYKDSGDQALIMKMKEKQT